MGGTVRKGKGVAIGRLKWVLVFSAVATAAPASEVDSGFFVGAGIGRASLGVEAFYTGDGYFRFEKDDFGYKIFGG